MKSKSSSGIDEIPSKLLKYLNENVLPYLLDCKPRLIKFFFPSCLQLKFKGGLHSRAVYIFFA